MHTAPHPTEPLAPAQRSGRALSLTGKAWQWPTLQWAPEADRAARPAAFGPSRPTDRPLFAWLHELLTQRGVKDPAARAHYLAPTLSALTDPCAMQGMAAAIDRLLLALRRGESVCVYGDYDVDGVCGSAIVSEFVREMGLTCEVYLPDRCAEGYGLNTAAVVGIAARHPLMVTVDCGSTSLDEVAAGNEAGLDTIIVDHHQVGECLPKAVAVLNPHRLDCDFLDKNLCATGVAFLLACGLRRALREREPQNRAATYDVRRLLDMVAVATVADMVPLTGHNRVLVHAGLQRLRKQPRPGLAALMQVAKVDQGSCRSTDLGFRLGPRINARGRLEHAGIGVTLMHASCLQEALPLAAVLDEANTARRSIERDTVNEATLAVQSGSLAAHAALVVAAPTWHPGVLGLVASRLVQRYHRPAVVIGEGGKGSARSIEGVNLHACLSRCQGLLQRFGGHPAAAGLTIAWDQIDAFRLALAAEVASLLGPPPYAPLLRPDLEVPFAALNLATEATLAQLEPFGKENPEVLFALRDMHVQGSRRVGDSHLKLRLSAEAAPTAGSVDAIAFGMGDLFHGLPRRLDVLGHLERSEFRGMVNAQLRVVDLRAAAGPGRPRIH